MKKPLPTTGGRHIRDPKTGRLKPEAKPAAKPEPTPDAQADAEAATATKGT